MKKNSSIGNICSRINKCQNEPKIDPPLSQFNFISILQDGTRNDLIASIHWFIPGAIDINNNDIEEILIKME